MTHRISRRARILSAGAAAAVLVPVAGVAAATPAAAAAAQVKCTSSAQPALAKKLTKDITAALKNRKGTIAVGFHDKSTKTTCTLRGSTAFDSASVVKVTVLATLLWDAKKTNRYLTTRESNLATAMITRSDNDATSALWRQLGVSKIKKFLAAAKMTKTVPGSGGYWGLTRVNVTDEQKLLALITGKNAVLSDNARAYISKLMGKVVRDQRWGTPAGAPSGTSIAVKNGWLPRATHGWRVHSIGAFKGRGHDYTISVLTHGNSNMNYGVDTIQRVSKAIHKDLTPIGQAPTRFAPTETPKEAAVPVPQS
ncbi:serine hydrolase [Streptomyces alboflavus]|uniref:serine hydrolase n=1 Tax=Streptomyces alboflavus TaxID=67267 RepID=UPI0004C276DA|nr:serine hydrolase [Streptomyces alboflavus]